MIDPVRVLFAIAAASLLLTPTASARTIQLGWNERFDVAGQAVMRFEVRSLTISKSGWSTRVSFRNLTARPVTITNRFALLHARTRSTRTFGRLAARSLRPRMPSRLAPGKSWSGTFSGTGAAALKRGVFVRVHFDEFVGRLRLGRARFGWVTDHAVRV
jgi:hypothetical protein